MMLVTSGKARLFALVALAILGSAPRARANINDYEFRLVETQFKTGQAIVSVRLIHKPDDKPAPDAVIFATRLDMAPDGMEMMTTDIEPSGERGARTFIDSRSELTMRAVADIVRSQGARRERHAPKRANAKGGAMRPASQIVSISICRRSTAAC